MTVPLRAGHAPVHHKMFHGHYGLLCIAQHIRPVLSTGRRLSYGLILIGRSAMIQYVLRSRAWW